MTSLTPTDWAELHAIATDLIVNNGPEGRCTFQMTEYDSLLYPGDSGWELWLYSIDSGDEDEPLWKFPVAVAVGPFIKAPEQVFP